MCIEDDTRAAQLGPDLKFARTPLDTVNREAACWGGQRTGLKGEPVVRAMDLVVHA